MKITALRFAAVVLILSASYLSKAAVTSYYFDQGTCGNTYTTITSGGTVHCCGGSDYVYAGTIGFTFSFNGSNYTTCWISTNGFIAFGSQTGYQTYAPIASTETYSGCISALGFNLGDGGVGELRSITQGTA